MVMNIADYFNQLNPLTRYYDTTRPDVRDFRQAYRRNGLEEGTVIPDSPFRHERVLPANVGDARVPQHQQGKIVGNVGGPGFNGNHVMTPPHVINPTGATGPNGAGVPHTPAPTTKEGWLAAVNKQFQPGSEYNAVPSSLLDDTISQILAEQQGSATDYLNRGLARGIYNDVGYNAGQAMLGSDASMGRSDLSTLGTGVIDKYRTNLNEVANNAYQAASGYEPGLKFSLDPYVGEYNHIIANANQNAGGDLRSVLGGKNYFDFSGLTNRAGQAQGALNLRDTDVATALAERRRKNSLDRGLGSQGAF